MKNTMSDHKLILGSNSRTIDIERIFVSNEHTLRDKKIHKTFVNTFDWSIHVVGYRIAQKFQSLKIPPMITFDEDQVPGGRKISFVLVTGIGFIVGTFAAIMGVAGGFLTFPSFVFLLGISSFTTVGTDIFQIIFTTGYASVAQYAIYGFIFISLAMGLLLGWSPTPALRLQPQANACVVAPPYCLQSPPTADNRPPKQARSPCR